jgi:hypothetical protein
VLERFLALAGKPAWEITEHDVDEVIAALVKRGVSQTTRRGYVQAFRGFFSFLQTRKAVEIETLFGCRLRDPLDRFNSARHVSSETPGLLPPPTVERVEAFFEFLRERLESARKWAPAARDYALFRTRITPGCERGKPRRSRSATCISTAARSASCTSAWGRARAGRGRQWGVSVAASGEVLMAAVTRPPRSHRGEPVTAALWCRHDDDTRGLHAAPREGSRAPCRPAPATARRSAPRARGWPAPPPETPVPTSGTRSVPYSASACTIIAVSDGCLVI